MEIRLSAEYLDEETAVHFPGLNPGPYAKLSISDTGEGIPAKIRDRIFEPYFTSKEPGEGTGLGLAVTHGIIQQHHGTITFDSKIGHGTTFHVMLPLETIEQTGDTDGIEAHVTPGKGRILLVDDEVSLVRIGEKALSQLGYNVDTEIDGKNALKRFMEKPNTYDLVISDQTMPHMTGLQLAQKIKAIRSDMPIILCTGFSASITPERLADIGIDLVIHKPIGIRQLSDAVHQLLKR